jgi:hypothetical protein
MSYDFKSDIQYYNVSSNVNEKMSQRVYIDQILKFVIKSWLDQKHDFVLEEDDDSSHDSNKSNIVRAWKEKHNLKHYFNCAGSSNLSFIKNCWVISKQHLRKFSHWDDVTIKELIDERWERVSQTFINEKVDEMPDRLRTVIADNDQMIDY